MKRSTIVNRLFKLPSNIAASRGKQNLEVFSFSLLASVDWLLSVDSCLLMAGSLIIRLSITGVAVSSTSTSTLPNL